jgi:GNAT superfamily N-acetyltransferase
MALAMDLLALYDAEERQHAINMGMRREEAPGLVRQVDLVGRSSTVLYSKLADQDLDRAIDEQVAYFAGLGHDLEWKAYAHDTPADLVERLARHGFAADEAEAIVVLDLSNPPAEMLEPAVGVRSVTDSDELRAFIPRFKEDRPDAAERLIAEMREDRRQLSVYIAEVDGQAASCGWVRFPVGTSFASLWGATTLPEFRKRGAYTRLVNVRVQEARQRGFRYVTVDAGSMSRPILEKRGFRVLTWATACNRSLSSGTG